MEIDLQDADLHDSQFSGMDLSSADFSGANLSAADFSRCPLSYANFQDARLTRTRFVGAYMIGANVRAEDVSLVNFEKANLGDVNFTRAKFEGVNFSGAGFSGASFGEAKLMGANFSDAWLPGAPFGGADLKQANFRRAYLVGASFWNADLCGADLRDALLVGVQMLQTNLDKAKLSGCNVYGVSAWDVRLIGAEQSQLKISKSLLEQDLIVDDLEVAQFIYLLSNNQKIRSIIDTLTSKVVLILGRFTAERKPVLEALRLAIRAKDYVPVMFDFDKPMTRDTQEAVTLLARMARFIIADITDAKSIPQELGSIVPDLPSVPVQPILQKGAEPWGMYDRIKRYPWVLPVHYYGLTDELLERLDELVLVPLETRVGEIRKELRQQGEPRQCPV